jgi:hypothetical protein
MSEMADHETDGESPESPVLASLGFLIKGKTEQEKVAILDTFYSFSKGDPKSFPVGFAVLLEAHASCMLRLPDDLKAGIDSVVEDSKVTLAAYQEAIEKCCKSLRNDVTLSAGHVATIHMMGSNLGAKIDLQQKHTAEDLKNHVQTLHAQFSKLHAQLKLHMEELKKARGRNPWLGVSVAFVLGFGASWLTRHFGL